MNIVSLNHAGSNPKSKCIFGLSFREHPVCTVTAAVVGVLYWIVVWAAYRGATSYHNALGYQWVSFMILSVPWFGIAGFNTLCLLLCSVNAAVIFVVVYVILSELFDRWLGA